MSTFLKQVRGSCQRFFLPQLFPRGDKGLGEFYHTEFIARNFECLADKAGRLLKSKCGKTSDILCGNQLQTRLRVQGQEKRMVLLDRRTKVARKVVHEEDWTEDRCGQAKRSDMLFYLPFTFKVRNSTLSLRSSYRTVDEMLDLRFLCCIRQEFALDDLASYALLSRTLNAKNSIHSFECFF